MIISSYNKFTKKYYEYDTEDVDESGPMFNKELHNNDITVQWNYPHKTTCAYCNTCFESRNKLFNHLGYMGIDIRHSGMDQNDEEYDKYIKQRKRQRRKRFQRWTWKNNRKRMIQKKKKKEISSLLLTLACISL